MPDANATTPRILAIGDNDVDCYDGTGLMYPGGNALNVAVFAARSGAQAGYIGVMANDPAGRHLRAALAAEGVDTSRLRRVPGRTAWCLIGLQDGEREFLRADPGVSMFAPDAADLAAIGSADAVHTSASSHLDAHLGAFAARARLSYDFADRVGPEAIARTAPLCFLASFSGGELGPEAVDALHARVRAAGAIWCLVTRGARGATLTGPGTNIARPPQAAVVTDTLGAGDATIARLLTGLIRAEAPEAALEAAARLAAETCARRGAFGHPAPMRIDERHALPISQVHAHAALLAHRATQRSAAASTLAPEFDTEDHP